MPRTLIVSEDDYFETKNTLLLGAKNDMNASLSYETQMSNVIIDFALTEEQVQLTSHALEAVTGQNPRTNAFSVEDVARAIIVARWGDRSATYDEAPDFTHDYEGGDHHVTNWMDGVAQLDRLAGPLEWHDELAPVVVREGHATTVTITITH